MLISPAIFSDAKTSTTRTTMSDPDRYFLASKRKSSRLDASSNPGKSQTRKDTCSGIGHRVMSIFSTYCTDARRSLGLRPLPRILARRSTSFASHTLALSSGVSPTTNSAGRTVVATRPLGQAHQPSMELVKVDLPAETKPMTVTWIVNLDMVDSDKAVLMPK